jgi:glutamate dehydrogenase/leucine dehydrogenase
VQGAGGVGGHLIELLLQAGAKVIASDLDPKRLAALSENGIPVVPADAALITPCDVLAPCAIGGILNRLSIPGLQCRVIAGAANNQLETASDADLLRERKIAYAPDFVINSGGVLHGGGLEELHWTRQELDLRLAAIGESIYEILQRAESDGTSTDTAARERAVARISGAAPSIA